jgi:hypothetical protein
VGILQLCTFHQPADGCRSGIVACSVCRLPARDLQRNRHDSHRSRAMTSIDLAARDAPAATEDVALRLQRCRRETSSDALGPILSDRNFAKDRAETAASRTPTALWQDKRPRGAGRAPSLGRRPASLDHVLRDAGLIRAADFFCFAPSEKIGFWERERKRRPYWGLVRDFLT